jgi:hypothetical protein
MFVLAGYATCSLHHDRPSRPTRRKRWRPAPRWQSDSLTPRCRYPGSGLATPTRPPCRRCAADRPGAPAARVLAHRHGQRQPRADVFVGDGFGPHRSAPLWTIGSMFARDPIGDPRAITMDGIVDLHLSADCPHDVRRRPTAANAAKRSMLSSEEARQPSPQVGDPCVQNPAYRPSGLVEDKPSSTGRAV